MKIKKSKINQSRVAALSKIKGILSLGDVEDQFSEVSGNYYSKDKFIVTWLGNWQGMPVEYSIDKVDAFYSAYSGGKAIYARRNLFYEKQLAAYSSIERALMEAGIKLCQSRKEKQAFFNQFAKPYNERIKAQLQRS